MVVYFSVIIYTAIAAMQQMLQENTTVVGLQRTLGHYIDSFAFGSPLEIRHDNDAFQHIADQWVSARINGKIIETIEVDLKTLRLVQSRGVCNQNTEYHDRIIRLINANAHLIKERITA